MKKIFILMIMLIAVTLSACQSDISESAMETAVSQVILTSASETSAEETSQESPTETEGEVITSEQLEEVNAQLENANLMLTEQAAEIESIQNELDGVYLLLTPTITPIPQDTPTPSITPSPTQKLIPTDTVMPWNHKYVEAQVDAPLYFYEDENDAGYPLMQKTSPIVKISKGTQFIVDTNRVRADGGGYYYLIVGPKHAGYYVSISDVKNVGE